MTLAFWIEFGIAIAVNLWAWRLLVILHRANVERDYWRRLWREEHEHMRGVRPRAGHT